MAERDARRYVVSGLVQGVGFRWATARLARRHGVAGTVRNRTDGSVEVTARGAPEILEGFERALATETPGRVDSIAAEPIATESISAADAAGEPHDFRILR